MNFSLQQLRSGRRLWLPKPGPIVRPPYPVVMADPPWQTGDSLGLRGAEAHYATMHVSDICAFQLPALTKDCVLFLWRLSSMPQEALDVIRAWGFTPKTEIVWRKETKTGKRWFGMGRITRAEHETCIVATRGRPQVLQKSTRSVFDAPEPEVQVTHDENGEEVLFYVEKGLFNARVGQHSAKPAAIYEIIESLYPGPFLSVFDRRQRRGWKCIGDEVTNNIPYADQGALRHGKRVRRRGRSSSELRHGEVAARPHHAERGRSGGEEGLDPRSTRRLAEDQRVRAAPGLRGDVRQGAQGGESPRAAGAEQGVRRQARPGVPCHVRFDPRAGVHAGQPRTRAQSGVQRRGEPGRQQGFGGWLRDPRAGVRGN